MYLHLLRANVTVMSVSHRFPWFNEKDDRVTYITYEYNVYIDTLSLKNKQLQNKS